MEGLEHLGYRWYENVLCLGMLEVDWHKVLKIMHPPNLQVPTSLFNLIARGRAKPAEQLLRIICCWQPISMPYIHLEAVPLPPRCLLHLSGLEQPIQTTTGQTTDQCRQQWFVPCFLRSKPRPGNRRIWRKGMPLEAVPAFGEYWPNANGVTIAVLDHVRLPMALLANRIEPPRLKKEGQLCGMDLAKGCVGLRRCGDCRDC